MCINKEIKELLTNEMHISKPYPLDDTKLRTMSLTDSYFKVTFPSLYKKIEGRSQAFIKDLIIINMSSYGYFRIIYKDNGKLGQKEG